MFIHSLSAILEQNLHDADLMPRSTEKELTKKANNWR